MDIHHRRLPRVDILALHGRMHAGDADSLKARIDQLAGEGRVRLVLDLAALEYVSSPGLRVLIEARRHLEKARAAGGGKGDLRLANTHAYVREILAQTGFTSFFPIYDDLVEAVGSF